MQWFRRNTSSMPPDRPATLRWLWVVLLLVGALLFAHARSLPAAWHGERMYSYAFDTCEGHFVSRIAPSPADEGGVPQGCDTLYSQRMGWDGWRRAREAWDARSSLVRFALSDFWLVATDARALNVLDLVLFVWPSHLLLAPAAGLAVLHLGLVALGCVSGVVFARTLGASPIGGLAAGTVVGGAGLVLESVQRGQYPQAVLSGALFFFAGLERIVRGQRHGVALAAGGAAFAALLYWQNGLILGVGAALFLAGRRLAGPFAPGAVGRLVAGALSAGGIAALPALPVIEALAHGRESKLHMEPWGTPFPVDATSPDALIDLIDEVPWFELLSPTAGWIPALPLLPLVALGFASRERLAWLFVACFGLLLALGPLPALPEGWGGRVAQGYGTIGRTESPLYLAVYQWVPTASRQRHPMRWGTLLVVGCAAAAAIGADRARRRWPVPATAAVGAGVVWTALLGPWPMREADYPGETLAALSECDAIVLPRAPVGIRNLDDVLRLEGLLWVPRTPARTQGSIGEGAPSVSMRRWSDRVEKQLHARLRGVTPSGPDLLTGTCVVYEAGWFGSDAPRLRAALVHTFGVPSHTLSPTDLFAADGRTRTLEVFEVRPELPLATAEE